MSSATACRALDDVAEPVSTAVPATDPIRTRTVFVFAELVSGADTAMRSRSPGRTCRGLMLIDLEAKDTLAGAAAYTRSVKIEGIGRGGKEREETLEIRSLNNAKTARAKKGKVADLGFKPNRVTRAE